MTKNPNEAKAQKNKMYGAFHIECTRHSQNSQPSTAAFVFNTSPGSHHMYNSSRPTSRAPGLLLIGENRHGPSNSTDIRAIDKTLSHMEGTAHPAATATVGGAWDALYGLRGGYTAFLGQTFPTVGGGSSTIASTIASTIVSTIVSLSCHLLFTTCIQWVLPS